MATKNYDNEAIVSKELKTIFENDEESSNLHTDSDFADSVAHEI
jgi:hypothetical protein